jgi:hypothetical protein
MGKYENLSGFQYGLWTILGNGKVVNKNRKVPVICKCGTKKEVYLQTILKGQSTSCGCSAAKKSSDRLIKKPIPVTLKDGIAARNSLLSQYKNVAKKRGIVWDITDHIFFALTKADCYYCGTKPANEKKTGYKTGSYIYNGIDRKDNSLGYENYNVVACCKRCNVAKNDMSIGEFKKWALKISRKATEWLF